MRGESKEGKEEVSAVHTFLHGGHAVIKNHPAQVSGERRGGEQLDELKLREPRSPDSSLSFLLLNILGRTHMQQRVTPQVFGSSPLTIQLLLEGACELRVRGGGGERGECKWWREAGGV